MNMECPSSLSIDTLANNLVNNQLVTTMRDHGLSVEHIPTQTEDDQYALKEFNLIKTCQKMGSSVLTMSAFVRGLRPAMTAPEFMQMSKDVYGMALQIFKAAEKIHDELPAMVEEKKKLGGILKRIPEDTKMLLRTMAIGAVDVAEMVAKYSEVSAQANVVMDTSMNLAMGCLVCCASHRRAVRCGRELLNLRNDRNQEANYYDAFFILFSPPSKTHSTIIDILNSDLTTTSIHSFTASHPKEFTPEQLETLSLGLFEDLFSPSSIPEDLGAACVRIFQVPIYPTPHHILMYNGFVAAIRCLLACLNYHKVMTSPEKECPPRRPQINDFPIFKEFAECPLRLFHE